MGTNQDEYGISTNTEPVITVCTKVILLSNVQPYLKFGNVFKMAIIYNNSSIFTALKTSHLSFSFHTNTLVNTLFKKKKIIIITCSTQSMPGLKNDWHLLFMTLFTNF